MPGTPDSPRREGPENALVADGCWADAVILGTPTRYGNIAPALRSDLDALHATGTENLRRLVWGGFASDNILLPGGRESTLTTLFRMLSQLGGVVVPRPPRIDSLSANALAHKTGRDVAHAARCLQVDAATMGTGSTGTY